MNFSLPVVVSKTCGCAQDLIHDNINGYLFEEGDIEALSGYIKNLLENEQLRRQYGNASLHIISDFSIKHIVKNMKEAI